MQTTFNKRLSHQSLVEFSPTVITTGSYPFPVQEHQRTSNVSVVQTNIVSTLEQPVFAENLLVHLGEILATTLVNILEELSKYNRDAVYPITSILEPYLKTQQELFAHIPPKSSREITINVARGGKARPTVSLD